MTFHKPFVPPVVNVHENGENVNDYIKAVSYTHLAQNCSRYGFILRYPKGKEKVTGIEYESWHFRYVGRDAAQFITKNDLTLEEFLKIAKIQQKTGR